MNKYEPLPTDVDFSIVAFEVAMASNPPFYLHVHPLAAERARAVLTDRESDWAGRRKAPIHVVEDDTLNNNEWYIVTAVGSDPP